MLRKYRAGDNEEEERGKRYQTGRWEEVEDKEGLEMAKKEMRGGEKERCIGDSGEESGKDAEEDIGR